MKLSEFFPKDWVIRDAEIRNTHYSNSGIPQTITFALDINNINRANNNSFISAIITTRELINEVQTDRGLVLYENPKKAFFEIHNYLYEKYIMKPEFHWGIDKSANIHDTVILGEKVFIGKNVKIDKRAIIENYSIINDNTYIGPNCIIGARGMHNTKIDGKFIYVEDAGGVKIGKNCEILANAVIQKNYFCDYTEIGDFNKVSVNTSIAHGTKIGNNNLIAGGAIISGFCSIGNNNWIGPSSVLAHNISIGNNCNIKIGSVVITNLIDDKVISGNFAINHKLNLKTFIKNQKL